MPNSDTWPRAIAMEPLSNMDSAGSCDSVISMNSGFSEDSMEHLSAEERACLMYLEETIESLDVQEDSGLSNDEPDPAILGLRQGDSALLVKSGLSSDIHSAPVDGGGPAGTVQVSHDPHLLSSSTTNVNDMEIPIKISAEPKHPGTETGTGSVSPVPIPLSLSPEGDPQRVLSDAKLSSKASSEMDLALIPPPSDFMDEPVSPPPQLDNKKPPALATPHKKPTVDLELLRQKAYAKRDPASTPVSPAHQDTPPSELCASPASLASSHQTGPLPVAAEPKSPPVVAAEPKIPPVVAAEPKSPQVVAAEPKIPQVVAAVPKSPQVVAAEPKSPPVVAPKPKKLPANILLKSHKSVGGCESNMAHPAPSTADRLLLDPQRVRIEALRKLGLLKCEEGDSGPALSPKHSPKTRRSWAAPSSPLSSPPPQATPPLMPSSISVSSMPPAHTPVPPSIDAVLPQSITSTSPSTAEVRSKVLPDILPVPAAFSDPVEPSHDSMFDTELMVTEKGNVTQFNPPSTAERLAPSMRVGVKSATLERSGLGLGSYIESIENNKSVSGEHSLSQLRNSRPRPASLGSRTDFSSAHGGVANSKDSQRSLPAPSTSHHSDSSQKLPRSQGISVLICPRAENEEARREALKKLGLLRD